MTIESPSRLTQFSRGAGCGCKIAPQVLQQMLTASGQIPHFPSLMVGHETSDDAAVYYISDTQLLISTADFFTPIVDDPFLFGQVAAANALSDVYAMGGNPLMALALLGWPVDKLPASMAAEVIRGARTICTEAGIPLAGGHSIDTPEPIFGLSVNGLIHPGSLKRNDTPQMGDLLLLTKPLGTGILSTAGKRTLLNEEDEKLLHKQLISLNRIGAALGHMSGVHALTDVTGFGLAGHLLEMIKPLDASAEIEYQKVPKMDNLAHYLEQKIVPDATYRNWNAYNADISFDKGVNVMEAFMVLPDPQTNGGLLMAVAPGSLSDVQELLRREGYAAHLQPIGKIVPSLQKKILVKA